MRDTQLYKVLLGVEEPWRIADVQMSVQQETITVRVELPEATRLPCPACGALRPIKDRRERQWRHLDTCQFKTLVCSPLPRTDCPGCGVKTVIPPWSRGHSRFTLLFERLAIEALLEMSIAGACRLLRISWDEADGIVQRAVGRGLERRDLSELRRISIDEKAVLKGHSYITIVTNLETAKVVWIGRDRSKETLDGFFASLDEKLLKQIDCIAMDMWEPYRASCRQWIEDADSKTTLDRFHIEKHLSEAVDNVRRQEHRELRSQGRDDLKGSRWDWLHRPENVSSYRREQFEALRGSDLRTARAWAIKEDFRRFWLYIYEGNARRFFGDWYGWAIRSRLEPIKKKAKMLKRHLERILNWFRTGATTAVSEGMNNKIQTIKKKAYGFRNVQRFINLIYFHCAGLDLFPP